MSARYDVIVVGARCAGSPLATHLARAGLSVAILDRASFPSDTASTHVIQSGGVAGLERLGVVDRVLATGAPRVEQLDTRHGDVHGVVTMPRHHDDPGYWLCVRRVLLDAILVEAAEAAGADVRQSTCVIGLIEEHGRVVGVRVRTEDGEDELRASLVVGADGQRSTVARLVGARHYNVVRNERFGYWGYYEGATREGPATIVFHRWDEDFVIACPADSGFYVVIVIPPLRELGAFRADPEASFEARVRDCRPAGAALASARRVGRLHTAVDYPGFFRESAGPGWVLVGDAGHFKDPAPGQGISDALRQIERLAPAIVAGLGGDRRLDRAMAKWWRWRDRDAREMHWFAADLGKAGPMPAVAYEMLRRIVDRPGGLERVVDVMTHRVAPSRVVSPALLMATTARSVVTGNLGRRDVLAQTWGLVSLDMHRRYLKRRPVMAPDPEPAPESRLRLRTVPLGGIVGVMTVTTYTVQGMTCDHCVRSVTEEIGEVAGVSSVEVSLEDKAAVVSGDADPDAVKAAVVEAGFEVIEVRS